MTRGPRRLKDDLDFQWETGCDLKDEQLVVGDYDLADLRTRVLAGVPPVLVGDGTPVIRVARGISWTRPLVGIASAAAAVGVAYWVGLQAATAPSAAARLPSAPIHAPGPPPTDPAIAVPAPRERPTVPVPRPLPPPAFERPAAVRETSAEAIAPTLPVSAPVVDSAAPPRKVRRPVEAELDAYDRAMESLKRGRFGDAAQQFRELEAANGTFTDEAALGLLQAIHGLGDAQATLDQLDRIQGRPSLIGKHSELLRLRAESLVRLGRCDEASAVAEQLSSKEAGDVHRTCRQQRKETPP